MVSGNEGNYVRDSDARRAEHVMKQDRLRYVECPDCKALLRLETKGDLPEDLKAVLITQDNLLFSFWCGIDV